MASGGYIRHLLTLGIIFFLVFAAFGTVQSLATNVNPGVGNAFLTAVYVMFTLCSIPGPRLVSVLGPKWSMAVGIIPYLLATAAFLVPDTVSTGVQYAVKITAGALVGFGAPLLWTGEGVYLSRIATRHATEGGARSVPRSEQKAAVESALARFNSVLFAFFQGNLIVGNLAAGVIFVVAGDNISGAYTAIFSSLTVVCALGWLISVFLLPDVEAVESAGEPRKPTVFETLSLNVRTKTMAMLMPINIYNGYSLGLIFGTWTVEGWRVAAGPRFPAFGTAIFATANVFMTIVGGKLAGTPRGRRAAFIGAFVSQVLFYTVLLFYTVPVAPCDPSGCQAGTSGPCFRIPGDPDSTHFPVGCLKAGELGAGANASACATCMARTPLPSSSICEPGWQQCDWIRGSSQSALPPVVILSALTVLFACSDAIWESQVPALLQSVFKSSEADVNAAMANVKLGSSIGFALEFILNLEGAPLNGVELVYSVVVALGMLLVSGALLFWTLYRVDANMNTSLLELGGSIVENDEARA